MGLRRFKNFRPEADSVSVKAPVLPPHQVRSNPRDLEALATVWRWEGIVRRLLPRVLASGDLEVRFQAIFDVRSNVPVLRAYEAYARFPAAPLIPPGLWFATAQHMGLAVPLSLLAGRTALGSIHRLPPTTVLFINTIPDAAVRLAAGVHEDTLSRIVFDLPASSFSDHTTGAAVDLVRQAGVGISFDDEPVAHDTLARLSACEDRLDFVKVDAHCDCTDLESTTRRLADWCHRRGIFLVAKRAESVEELEMLRDAGVDWAQGHILSRDVSL